MFKINLRTPLVFIALLVAAMTFSATASAKCGCPGDGHGTPTADSGLGQEFPAAQDLAADAAWQVYEFERDGIRYTQINDQFGNVRAAIGRIEDTFWTMPIGIDADRVVTDGASVPAGVPSVLFRSDEVEVVLYQNGLQQNWVVRSPASLAY
jgi:hypothetical protein